MKMIAFKDIAPFSLFVVVRRFRGAYCLHDQDDDIALVIEVLCIFETSAYFNKTT
jgi:hypothetical protein